MNHIETKQIFLAVVQAVVGTTRVANEGGTEDGKTFTLEQNDVESFASTLAEWWGEGYEETDVTPEMATKFFNEVYPEEVRP